MLTYGCSFRENDQACPEKPVYKVEMADCTACREEGFLYCTGHRACVMHGADARADELLFASDDHEITIVRIRSLVAS